MPALAGEPADTVISCFSALLTGLQVSEDHEGDDQSVKADTFCKSYEDKGFTKNSGVLAQCAKRCACCACNCDTTADTGESCYECGCDISEACCKTGTGSRRLSCLDIRSPQHHDGRQCECAEKEKCI